MRTDVIMKDVDVGINRVAMDAVYSFDKTFQIQLETTALPDRRTRWSARRTFDAS
jgi:hypothetical protein